MIIQITNSNHIRPLEFINTDHIVSVSNQWEWNDEGTKKWCIGVTLKLSDGSVLNLDDNASSTIGHYLRLQYLKDSAEVCGKLDIEEAE